MDTSSNHLVSEEFLDRMEDTEDYTPIPEHLHYAASVALAGKAEANISKHSGGKLSKWAASERKKKRKAQKLSLRKNR